MASRSLIPLLFLLLFFHSGPYADSTLLVFQGDSLKTQPWRTALRDSAISIDTIAAIHGPLGIRLTQCRKEGGFLDSYLSGKTGFMTRSHHRHYFRVVRWPAEPPVQTPRMANYFQYNFAEKMQREQPLNFMDLFISEEPALRGLNFGGRIHPSVLRIKDVVRSVPILPGRTYCVETDFDFFSGESVETAVRLDGSPLFKIRTPFPYTRDFISVAAGNQATRGFDFELHLDDAAVSDHRLFSIPPAPSGCRDTLRGFVRALAVAPFTSSFLDERQNAMRWQLIDRALPDFPLFDAVDLDPVFHGSRSLPFALDSGAYQWRAAFQNNFGNWGDWSPWKTLDVREQRRISIRLDKTFPSLLSRESAITSVVPGRWVHLYLYLKPMSGWDSISHILIRLNHPDYPFGHMENKGGKFLKASNYIINVSLLTSDRYKAVYEKPVDNSMETIRLDSARQGLYLDGNPDEIVVDTVRGLVRVKARLLEGAKAGRWQLLAQASDRARANSNACRFFFDVPPPGPASANQARLMVFIALAGLLVALALFLVIRGRKSIAAVPAAEDPELMRFVQYLKEHIQEDLSVQKVRADLRLSDHGFRALLKRHDIPSLPKYLNNLRIETAKEMLRDPGNNISEIGYKVGFLEARYFSKVFKDLTLMTPSDYRDQVLQKQK